MFELDIYGTLVAASGVLLLGQLMLKRIPLLAAYTIPEPVAGGLLAALLLLAARSAFGFQVQFDNSLGAPLMLTFFACIGLNADLASLRQGGRPLMIFLAVVLGFLDFDASRAGETANDRKESTSRQQRRLIG